MQARRLIFWFVAIVAVLIAIVVWHGKRRPLQTLAPGVVETNTAASATIAVINPTMSGSDQTNDTRGNLPIATANVRKPPPRSDVERMQGILSKYNDVPIVFYGKIEDQFSNPVPNALVNFGIRVLNGYESTVKTGQVISDASGLFTISGYKGQDLGIGVVKPGYAWISMNGSGSYSLLTPEEERAHPDSNNPTVIKMWKLQGARPLVTINQRYKLHYTKATINIDLLAGKIAPDGGDIQLTVNRAAGIISGRSRLDWNVQVAAVNGGVMDSGGQERVTYAAPDSGYQPSMTFMFSTNAPYKWFGGFTQGFFVMSRNAQVYSKLVLSFDINMNSDGFMYITLSGVASTNGSRDWEGDVNTMQPVAQ